MRLRPYQENLIKNLYTKIREGHKSILCVAPTGSGKTIIFCQIVLDALSKGRSVLILLNREPLVDQTTQKLKSVGVDSIDYIKAGYDENPESQVTVASTQSLLRRRSKYRDRIWDVVILDEAHETSYTSVGRSILENPLVSYKIGFTATPYRLKKTETLKDFYSVIMESISIRELEDQGYLTPLTYYGVKTPILTGVKSSMGDYRASDLEKMYKQDDLYLEDIVKYWKKYCNDKRTIAFCSTVNHAKDLAKELNKKGIPSECVVGETEAEERRRLYSLLDSGDIKVLTSVDVLSTGFDLPSIEAGILLRPTKSRSKFEQQLGRFRRVNRGKTRAIILDFSGNVSKFGFPEDIEEHEFEEKQTKARGELPLKTCPRCKLMQPVFNKECPGCGHVFSEPKEDKKQKVELVKLHSGVSIPKHPKWKQHKHYQAKLREAFRKGNSPNSAYYKFKNKYPDTEIQDTWVANSIYAEFSEENLREYTQYLKSVAVRLDKSDYWVKHWVKLQFPYTQ